ncbi:ornithine decarboxylase antizyme with +1 programmed ribosomal shift Spa1 [Trifolium repens]|nr:ornithine decarboxylase antizyme with +1 programmed ribosomal shift Spa1 [Trifolium repens]
MTANNGRGSNQEHKRKINDPLPRSCTPRNVTSLAGSGPTSTSFCSTTDPKHIVEKLHVRNYKNLNHQLAFESKYSNSLSRDIPLKVKGGLKGKGIDSRKNLNLKLNLNHHQPDKGFVNMSNIENTLKGKEVIYKDLGNVVSGAECFNDELNLRVWMKSESRKMKKSERLYLFKQILELVDFAHSQGFVLQDLKPSCFALLPSNKIKYVGSYGQQVFDDEKSCFTLFKSCLKAIMTCNVTKKMPWEEDTCGCQNLNGTKKQKLCEETTSLKQQQHHFNCNHGCDTNMFMESNLCLDGSSYQHAFAEEKQFISETIQLEEKWYSCPEVLNDGTNTFSSNVYSLGVLVFELLCNIESLEAHSSVMFDMRHRILPPKFLSQNAKEAGFCLWLLHPEPSSRPNTKMILESEFIRELAELNSGNTNVIVSEDDVTDTEELLHFLNSVGEGKKKQEAKLAEELNCLNEDIKEVERNHSYGTDSAFHLAQLNYLHYQDSSSKDTSRYFPSSFVDEARFMSNINQLENSYFSMRFQSSDKSVMENRLRLPHLENVSNGGLGPFFDGICKFARYSKFEERGTLRNSDLLSSANVICALSFDRDEDYIAAGGISKKIKIFDLNAASSDSVDIQYPVVEMSNKSKLSCVCWNSYIKNHLASTDYDGVVQMWDAGTGQPLSQYMEHQKRAWSVHFSVSDPKMFASGSDDCSIKLWNISERNSIGTILSPANVCCVQFSEYSTNLLFFGSADYKVYGYDLRNTKIPWCTLAGHGKAVSYIKFIDAQTVVSASTDNSLKLWNLKKTSSAELSSDACDLTFRGHSNEKNFVGLSVLDGYIACGSESNEVYCYHKSLPVPIASHRFESNNPISGHSNSFDNNGQFVSSVCWRKKSNMLVAANSVGIIKLLKMA